MDSKPATIELFKRGTDAGDKFDYFVCGVTGAVFSYEIQHYLPQKIGWHFYLLEPLSLLLLVLAFFFGLRRLATSSLAARLNHRLIDVEDKIEQLCGILDDPKSHKDLSREPVDVPRIQELHRQHLEARTKLSQLLSGVEIKASKYYKLRDGFLLFGFAAIFLAKVLQPYETGASQIDRSSKSIQSQGLPLAVPTTQTNGPNPQLTNAASGTNASLVSH